MRRTAFTVIVLVLVALGAYLLGPVAHGAGRPASHGSTSRPSEPVSAPAGSPAASPPGQSDQTGPDIYQWLPFTQAGLAAAVSVVTRFGDAYGTFSYTESADTYAASLQAMTAPQLVAQIKAAYSTPGVASARSVGKQVSAGSALIESLRAFGPTSLTFVVLVTQRLTQQSGRSQVATSYAVTVTGTGTSWQVSDVELAAAGNS
jgi:hypothetical protein